MKDTRILMGMPITVEITDRNINKQAINKIFDYFETVDYKFSTYKKESEISHINNGIIKVTDFSNEMKEIFALSEETKKITNGYFDIETPAGIYDPSGIVKGWAIHNASNILKKGGFNNFYIDAGGDIQTYGKNWKVGIRNPLNTEEIIKILELSGEGIATSGTYIRGDHIYNPKDFGGQIKDIISLTVIGPNVYEADRFATAAYAMGLNGIDFIEQMESLEGYSVDNNSVATFTSGFERYISN